MRKITFNFWLDLMIALAFVIETISGVFLLAFTKSWIPTQWGLVRWIYAVGRLTWTRWHDWAALVLVIGVILHIILHWRWVVSMAKRLWQEAFHSNESA